MAILHEPTVIYYLCALGVLVYYCIFIRCLQVRREPSPENGLLVLAGWSPVLKVWITFAWVMLLILPFLLVVISYIGALILAPVEGWVVYDTFDYILCNTLAVGPFNDLTPHTREGKLVALLVSVVVVIVTNSLLGFGAALGAVEWFSKGLPEGVCGFTVTLFLLCLVLLVLNLIFSSVLSAVEDADLFDVYVYVLGLLCGIENPLIDWQPKSREGDFLTALISGWELTFAGILIGAIGNHPLVTQLVSQLQGTPRVRKTSMLTEHTANDDFPDPETAQRLATAVKELALAKKEIDNLKGQLAVSQATIENMSQPVPPQNSVAEQKLSEASPDDSRLRLEGAQERIRELEDDLEKEKEFRFSFQQNLWKLQTKVQGYQVDTNLEGQLEYSNKRCWQLEHENSQLRELIAEMQQGNRPNVERLALPDGQAASSKV